jgi:hypothetical protein
VFKIATPSSVGFAMTVKVWQFQFGSETELTKVHSHCEEEATKQSFDHELRTV